MSASIAKAPDGLDVIDTAWQSVVLVCKECQKRGSGPKHLTAKDVRTGLKTASKSPGYRTRIVQTACLGACPKRAITVVVSGNTRPLLMAAVSEPSQIEALAGRLANRPAVIPTAY